MDTIGLKPFLKWTGGKQWLAGRLASSIRERLSGRYYEPFAGGAAVFFELRPTIATLSDTNSDLVATYRAVRDDVESVIDVLAGYPHSHDFFDEIRQAAPQTDVEKAARLVYLNKTAFNGIYRVNKDGQFNVPFGKYVRPTLVPRDRLRAASLALKGVDLLVADFADAVEGATEGDVVYFDPPYITGHTSNGFLKYNARLFSPDDQIRLSATTHALVKRGVCVVLSNADYSAIPSMYPGYHAYRLQRRSLIAAAANKRGEISEIVISNSSLELCDG